MSTDGGKRIHGPYKQPNGTWRVIVVHRARPGQSGRTSTVCRTESEALDLIAQLRAEATAQTVAVSLGAYFAYLALKGNAPRSICTTEDRLSGLTKPMLKMPITDLTPARAAMLYARYSGVVAVDTHRNALSQARTWGKWLVKSGWLKRNPWLDVEPVGKRRAGKAQLRLDEARRFTAVALELAESGDEGALASLVALLLGLRASEVVNLLGRDIDDNGRILWTASKSAAGRRTLEIPAVLQPLLLERVRCPQSRLFERRREWVRDSVRRLCRLAEVPVVTAHGLRGVHATLATSWGVTGHAVSAALGHAGTAVTEKHYTAAGSKERASVRKLGELLDSTSSHPLNRTRTDKDK